MTTAPNGKDLERAHYSLMTVFVMCFSGGMLIWWHSCQPGITPNVIEVGISVVLWVVVLLIASALLLRALGSESAGFALKTLTLVVKAAAKSLPPPSDRASAPPDPAATARQPFEVTLLGALLGTLVVGGAILTIINSPFSAISSAGLIVALILVSGFWADHLLRAASAKSTSTPGRGPPYAILLGLCLFATVTLYYVRSFAQEITSQLRSEQENSEVRFTTMDGHMAELETRITLIGLRADQESSNESPDDERAEPQGNKP